MKETIACFIVIGLFYFLAPFSVRAALLVNPSDVMSTQAINTPATHTISWTMDSGHNFTTGDAITVDFTNAHFTLNSISNWQTSDFSFNDGTARTILAVSSVSGTPPVCTSAGANNVCVTIDTSTDTFTIFPTSSGFNASLNGANITFVINGTAASGSGTMTNGASDIDSSLVTITDSGSNTDATQFAVAVAPNDVVTVTATVNPSASNSGGGGGTVIGGGIAIPTTVIFSGTAYPYAQIHILRDGMPVLTVNADSNGIFSATLSGLPAGSFSFALFATDQSGTASSMLTFPLILSSGARVTIQNLFFPPTINVNPQNVQQGESVHIFGHSVQNSAVTLHLTYPGGSMNTTAGTNSAGEYSFLINTRTGTLGTYSATTEAVRNIPNNPKSQTVFFTVGPSLPQNLICNTVLADINCDGKVNISDFSILLFWYGKTNPPAKVDLNHDGVVTIPDFSILLYYWTS